MLFLALMVAGSVCPCVMFVLCLLLCWAVGLLNVGMATFSNSVFLWQGPPDFPAEYGTRAKSDRLVNSGFLFCFSLVTDIG